MGMSRLSRGWRHLGIVLVAGAVALGMGSASILTSGLVSAGAVVAAGCDGEATPIWEIQGAGAGSSKAGEEVTVRGVVTADLRARERLSGFFIQQQVGD